MMDSGLEIGTEEENYVEVLSILIDKYEIDNEFKIDPIQLDGNDVLTYFMEENRLQQKDLIPFLGPASRVSEILNKKRKLSLKQIKALHSEFKIPIHLLMVDNSSSIPERSAETNKESKGKFTYKEKKDSLHTVEDLSVLENRTAYLRKDMDLSEGSRMTVEDFRHVKQKAIQRADKRFDKLKGENLDAVLTDDIEKNQNSDDVKMILFRINETLNMLYDKVLLLGKSIEELEKK